MGIMVLELYELLDRWVWSVVQAINRHLHRLQNRVGIWFIHPLKFNILIAIIAIVALVFSDVGQIRLEETPTLVAYSSNYVLFIIFYMIYMRAYTWLAERHRKDEEKNIVSIILRCYGQAALLNAALILGVGMLYLGKGEFDLTLVQTRTTIFYVVVAYLFYVGDEIKGGQPPKKRSRRRAIKANPLEALRQRLFGATPQVR